MHANGWSEDLAWNRNRKPNPLWVHWYSLIASMGDNKQFSGTINALR